MGGRFRSFAVTLFTTYRVPSDTSRAKSGPVFAARTITTVDDLLVAGSAGPNAARIMPKEGVLKRYVVNSLAAPLPPTSV